MNIGWLRDYQCNEKHSAVPLKIEGQLKVFIGEINQNFSPKRKCNTCNFQKYCEHFKYDDRVSTTTLMFLTIFYQRE